MSNEQTNYWIMIGVGAVGIIIILANVLMEMVS